MKEPALLLGLCALIISGSAAYADLPPFNPDRVKPKQGELPPAQDENKSKEQKQKSPKKEKEKEKEKAKEKQKQEQKSNQPS